MDFKDDPQVQTMISNIPEKTRKPLEEWFTILSSRSLEKHGDMMKVLKGEYGMTHGFANTIVLLFRQKIDGGPKKDGDLVVSQYENKDALKPINEKIDQKHKRFWG